MFVRQSPELFRTIGRYVLSVTLLNLFWEVFQLPLYTVWSSGTVGENTFAVLHCTVGDALIASVSLTLSLLIFGAKGWPDSRFKPVAMGAILFGVGYTIYSEWRNTTVTLSWAYSQAMPTLLGIGLSPVAQWLVIPGFVFWWTHRRLPASQLGQSG